MKMVIEFYRTWDAAEADAVVGRETAEAGDLYEAIKLARLLYRTSICRGGRMQ